MKWKSYDNSFSSWIIMKDSIRMSQYFPDPYKSSSENVKVELDLFNYAAETDMKRATHIDTHVLK